MDDLQSIFVVALAAATVRSTAPLLFAAMGGLLSERSGVMNIGLEGFMLFGAFAAAAGSYFTGNAWIGLLVALVVGAVSGWVYAVWAISLRADQIVAGTAIDLLGVGLPAFLVQRIWNQAGGSPTVNGLPDFGGISILAPVAFLLVPAVWWILKRTKAGLRVMAAGESPTAAESVGIDVPRYRYACVVAAGALAGLGGAYLSIGDLSQFTTNMTAGRGFIALAAVIFGNWTPFGALGATLLFGFAQALRYQVQALGWPIPQELIVSLPYIMTLVAITGLVGRSTPPAGLGRHATAD
ncbi:MAG TPA: ABC transporter permease [Thermomicrobiales bacterium]|nr:ABC transporter permease [Thermomicrobiales bacterium]